MKNYLTEAFKKLDVLDEDVFELDDDGIAQLKDFEIKSEEDDTVSIIDPEAEDEADLSDNYLGKVILDCCVCHSKIYKDADDVHLDEDGELANVDEECPFCYSTDGYKVIGQVTEFNPASEEEVEVKAEEDGDEEEVNVEVKDKEEVEESVKCKKGRCAEKCDEKVSTRDDIDAEADDHLAVSTLLIEIHSELVVVVADGLVLAPHGSPGVVVRRHLRAGHCKAVEQVGLIHALAGVLVGRQLKT